MQKRYVIDVKLTGYTTVYVYAENLEEAHEKASDYFTQNIMPNPINDLNWISTETTLVGDEND